MQEALTLHSGNPQAADAMAGLAAVADTIAAVAAAAHHIASLKALDNRGCILCIDAYEQPVLECLRVLCRQVCSAVAGGEEAAVQASASCLCSVLHMCAELQYHISEKASCMCMLSVWSALGTCIARLASLPILKSRSMSVQKLLTFLQRWPCERHCAATVRHETAVMLHRSATHGCLACRRLGKCQRRLQLLSALQSQPHGPQPLQLQTSCTGVNHLIWRLLSQLSHRISGVNPRWVLPPPSSCVAFHNLAFCPDTTLAGSFGSCYDIHSPQHRSAISAGTSGVRCASKACRQLQHQASAAHCRCAQGTRPAYSPSL